jgi:A/G-specific adenine glycosylase
VCAARAAGRQEELPGRAPKRAPPEVEQDAVLVTKGGAWLFCRRAPRGLMGGLWELPDPAGLAAADVDRRRTLARHTQKLSHRTIHHRVFAGRVRGAPRPRAPYDAARFVPPDELGALGVSSATAALAAMLKSAPWPTPPRRTPSSARGSRRSSRG